MLNELFLSLLFVEFLTNLLLNHLLVYLKFRIKF